MQPLIRQPAIKLYYPSVCVCVSIYVLYMLLLFLAVGTKYFKLHGCILLASNDFLPPLGCIAAYQ